jgi:hypothetical protein
MKNLFSSVVPSLALSLALVSGVASAGERVKKNDGGLYLRLQQAPLIGLAAVSDSGVIDVELMKSVNRNFWIGPTIVAHADSSEGSKMKSLNLGVRADFILPAFGNIEEGVYISTALLFGAYKSQTFTETWRWSGANSLVTDEVTCDFKVGGPFASVD